MVLDNDTRGWILTLVSSLACVLGASVICIDRILQCIPSMRNFRIEDSNVFLSSSLSLSFGVMLFSSLYGVLPSSKSYLVKGGLSQTAAAYALIGLFMVGVIGIQVVSRFIHHHIPSHVVGCDHSHDEVDESKSRDDADTVRPQSTTGPTEHTDRSPLLESDGGDYRTNSNAVSKPFISVTAPEAGNGHVNPSKPSPSRALSFQARLSRRVSTLVTGGKASCDHEGPCRGYSDPCGQECFKVISRSPTWASGKRSVLRQGMLRTSTAPHADAHINETRTVFGERQSQPFQDPEHWQLDGKGATGPNDRQDYFADFEGRAERDHPQSKPDQERLHQSITSDSLQQADQSQSHHHHVPTNAFLSIGLQTAIAIALHKCPEGFITFATNHADARLGFSVFIALFIHNITEGFAMALPLYLALGNRYKAMFWSFLLGGLSQPLGAGIAAIWFRAAGNSNMAPGAAVYGGMFAVTAGIMSSVALQLFSEGLALTHNRNLCMVFAFIGMGILGLSFALTAE